MKNTIIFITFWICFINSLNAQWQYVNNIPTTNNLYSVYFPTPDTGYAVGAFGTIIMTSDSGNTWISQISNTTKLLHSVTFVDANTGWAVGDSGTILKTSNGGTLWTSQSQYSYNYRSVYFVNTDTGYVTGHDGVIIKTTDGGNNWSIKAINPNHYLSLIYFKSLDTGFVGGMVDTLLCTIDGGNTWTPKTFGALIGIYTMTFLNANIGFGTGSNYIVKTIDGGNTWYSIPNYLADYMPSLFFTNVNYGYIVGGNWSGDAMPHFLGSVILKTDDGGITWDSLINIASSKILNSIFFTNANTGIIVGEYGTVLKTTNGGNTWIENNENFQNENINIYPNPVNDFFNIKINEKNVLTETILIEDIQGSVIKNFKSININTPLNISFLLNGIYIIRVITKDNVYTQKLVKQ